MKEKYAAVACFSDAPVTLKIGQGQRNQYGSTLAVFIVQSWRELVDTVVKESMPNLDLLLAAPSPPANTGKSRQLGSLA